MASGCGLLGGGLQDELSSDILFSGSTAFHWSRSVPPRHVLGGWRWLTAGLDH